MNEKNEVIKLEQEKPNIELLPKMFHNFDINNEIGNKGFGSKNFVKMVLFAVKVQLDNNDINYWMTRLHPSRMENESYPEYKMRIKFQDALIKFRPSLYQYSKVDLKPSTKRTIKIKKQLGIV